jgi:hypothetical protein
MAAAAISAAQNFDAIGYMAAFMAFLLAAMIGVGPHILGRE